MTNKKDHNKALSKCPALFSHPESIVPDSSVVEQASSHLTGDYVASLLPKVSFVVDLTAGLGTNTLCFSRVAKSVIAIEIDGRRAEVLRNNMNLLDVRNVEIVNDDCLNWLKDSGLSFDVAFADPARRDTFGSRHLKLQDYSPDISVFLPLLRGRCKRLLLKVSPLLDIKAILESVPGVKGIHILEVSREVKELIIDVNPDDKEITDDCFIKCILLHSNKPVQEFEFRLSDKESVPSPNLMESKDEIGEGDYIYEPSPALMKAGMHSALINRMEGLKKMHQNTHLFLSHSLIENFPGRVFKIDKLLGSKELKKLKGERYNVISRNHPFKAAEIEKRYSLKSSESQYLIAGTAGKDKFILSASKLLY